jgi:hypothetical protein
MTLVGRGSERKGNSTTCLAIRRCRRHGLDECVLPGLLNVINTVIRVYLDPIGPDGILVKNEIDRYGEIMTMIQD